MAISRFPSLLHASRKLSHLKLRLKSSARLFPKQHRFISIPPPSCHPSHHSSPSLSKNFLALCASNYYDGCLFHRNIKGFMIQAGDPTGTGKAGQSIWGKPFPDEIRSTLKVHTLRSILHAHRSAIAVGIRWRLCSSFIPAYSSTPVASSQWQILDLTPTSLNSSSHMLNRHILIQNTPSLAR